MNRPSLGPTIVLAIAALLASGGCQPEQKFAVGPATQRAAQTGETGEGAPVTTAPSTTENPTGTPTETPTTTAPDTSTPGAVTPSLDTGNTTPPPPIATGAGGPVTLKFAFQKGDVIKFKSTTESTMGGGPRGGSSDAGKTSSTAIVKVVDVTGGKAKVELSVSDLKMDTGPVPPGNGKKQMDKMVSDAKSVVVSTVFDELGTPSNVKYVTGNRFQAMAAGLNSDTGFFGLTYPDHQVKPGDSWTHTFDFRNALSAMGPLPGATWANSSVTTKFTLKSVDAGTGIATIAITVSGNPSVSVKLPQQPPREGTKNPQMPTEMKMSFKLTGSGTATVDVKTGLPQNVDYELGTEFNSPAGGAMTQKTRSTLKKM